MLLASKLEEYYPVELTKLIHLTDYSYKHRQVLEMFAEAADEAVLSSIISVSSLSVVTLSRVTFLS